MCLELLALAHERTSKLLGEMRIIKCDNVVLFLYRVTYVFCFIFYGRTLSERPCYILPMFFYIFFILAALVGQTAERIFTKLSHVVDIRHHL